MAPELVDRFALRAHITAVEQAAERTRLIRIAGPALEGLHWIPGQHVRVLTSGPLNRMTDLLRTSLRTYSMSRHCARRACPRPRAPRTSPGRPTAARQCAPTSCATAAGHAAR